MIRLAVQVDAARAEVVLAELLELAPGGVEERAIAPGVVEYAVYGPPGELPALPDLRAAAGGALIDVRTQQVPDDWAERWREFHRPLVLGAALTVRPPWEPPGPSALDIVIDPGQAFGTGAHATTRLCLELALELEPAGAFLDLGCGSGVLAILAARRGFHPVLALDNDPASLAATAGNAERNGVSLDVRRFDLRAAEPLPGAPTVAANLLGPLLVSLGARLAAAGPRPEALIAGGLLATEASRVQAAFTPAGLRVAERRDRGEWAALLLVS